MYFNKDDFSIYYEKHGNKKDNIIILPGWGNTRSTFYHLINKLKNYYTVYIIDYPGFGRSIFPDKDLTIYDYTNIIRDFIEHENIDNPSIIAHSFGGRIATLLCGYYKDNINKLVLMDIAGIKPKKSLYLKCKQLLYKVLKKFQYLIPKRKRNIYLRKLIRLFGSSDYKLLDKNMYNSFKNIVNEDLKYYMKFIDNESLIIWGKLDKDTKLSDGKIINNLIKKSKLYILEEAGHFSYLEYPDYVYKLIYRFLKDE